MPQSVYKEPLSIHRSKTTCVVSSPKVKNTVHDKAAAKNTNPVVKTWLIFSPKKRQPKPQSKAPKSGAKSISVTMV